MRSGKSTSFSIVPFVPGSFYAKNPKLLSLRCLQHHRRVFQQETKVWVQVLVEVEARDNKENIPKKSTGDRSRSSTHGRGGQEVQEVIYQCRELEKTAQIQKGTDCKDTSENSLTVMMMMKIDLSQKVVNR